MSGPWPSMQPASASIAHRDHGPLCKPHCSPSLPHLLDDRNGGQRRLKTSVSVTQSLRGKAGSLLSSPSAHPFLAQLLRPLGTAEEVQLVASEKGYGGSAVSPALSARQLFWLKELNAEKKKKGHDFSSVNRGVGKSGAGGRGWVGAGSPELRLLQEFQSLWIL